MGGEAGIRLGDAVLKIGSGATPKGGKEVYLSRGDVSLIRSQNVYNDRFSKDGLVWLLPQHAEQLNNVEVQENDVLLNITGDSVARCCLVPNEVLPARVNQHVAIIRPDPLIVNPQFLRYFLISPSMQDHMLGLASSGATRNALTKLMIENFIIPPYSIEDQIAIASVLSALDDKIELNRQMNQTLEGMARALFEDWFVDFGPVKAKAAGQQPPGLAPEIADLFPDAFDEAGVPVGWEIKRVEDLMELIYGKALKSSERVNGAVPVYGSGGITGYHNTALTDGPSIIIGRKGTVGSLYWEERSFYPIDTVFYVKPKTPLTFCFYLLQTLRLEHMNTDAAVPGLNRNNVYRLLVPLAPNTLIQSFDKIVSSVRQKICLNETENNYLMQLRDTLLPKLMSGEVRVKSIEEFSI